MVLSQARLRKALRLRGERSLVRITQPDNTSVEVRSPFPGSIARILTPGGTAVVAGASLLTINSDEDSIWEALRGLALVGEADDLPAVNSYTHGSGSASDRIKQQAALTANAIRAALI